MRRYATVVALALSCGLGMNAASAQTPSPDQVRERQKAVALTGGTPGESSLARSGAEAILEGVSDDSKATARLGVTFEGGWSLDGTFSSPLDEDFDRTAVLTASDHPLATDARFSVGGSRIYHRFGVDRTRVDTVCAEVKQRQLGPCNSVNQAIPQVLRDQLQQAIFPLTSWAVGARFTVGRSDFSYRELDSGPTFDVSHATPIAMTGTVGALFPNNWFTLAQVGVERVWQQGNKARNLCTPTAPGSGVSECEEVSVGVPADSTGPILALEARRFFTKIAVAPRFEYRRTKKLKVFELPVYFLSDPETGGWTGGVVFRMKNDDPSLAVFVGAALPYFGLR
jgi:hypothetical protein